MAPHVPPSTYAPWGAARAGTPADAIDGVTPQCVVDVDSGASLAAALAHAATNGHRTVVRGGGTKVEWGRAPASVDVIVSTAHLNRIVWHSHGDLVATIQAGTPLATVNAALGGEGQWLPLDSAHDGATVGGMVAANETGPMRHRWGAPRDLLIGVTLALTDGRVVKAGGRVVKNVAGYDIGRLMSGSFGSLAAIVDATFKLAPRPASSTSSSFAPTWRSSDWSTCGVLSAPRACRWPRSHTHSIQPGF